MNRLCISRVCRSATGLLAACALFAAAAPASASLIDVTNAQNVLPGAGRAIMVSSAIANAGLNDKTALIDNFATANDADGSFMFGQGDSPNRLSISGFNGGFDTIRTAADPSREPTLVTIKSSTSLASTLTAGEFETTLLSNYSTGVVYPTTGITLTPYPGLGDGRGYFDLSLTTPAPAGTQSLFLSMTAPTSGVRIYELQALAVPEPATAGLLAAAGLLALRRRA